MTKKKITVSVKRFSTALRGAAEALEEKQIWELREGFLCSSSAIPWFWKESARKGKLANNTNMS